MAKRILVIFFLFLSSIIQAQVVKDSLPQREFNPYRFAGVLGAGTAFYGGTLASLYTVWYQDNHRTGFHWTNDNAGWLQIDKYGHAYTCYLFGKLGMQSLRWAGVKDKKAVIYGGSFGFLFMTSVEILDAHYEEWGASPMDMVANASGGLLLVGQELAFKKQIVTYKFSYHHTDLAQYRPGVLGGTDFERLVEDYNGQTFWLSTNIRSIFPNKTWIPSWLNIAPGYGAYGMLAGEQNPLYASDGNLLPPIFRQRSYYVSLDIDWDKIPTESKFLKSVFFFLNFIKFPLPTYEVNSFGESRFHAFYF
ncbi:MAG: DUF2279 domain-containing protein [Flavobacteriales bacterium]|nr:DUF2279 domain-containing protein [Flavobacteriales bacterium]